MKKVISTTEAPAAIGPYSQAIEVNGFVFCSGQIPLSPDKNTAIPADISGQTTLAMQNVGAILKAAGLTYSNVVKTTIFLTDMSDFATVNEIYGKHFPENPPARSTVAVAGLPRGVKVEIECLATRN